MEDNLDELSVGFYAGTIMTWSNKFISFTVVLPVYLTCSANELFMMTCQGNLFLFQLLFLQYKEIKFRACLFRLVLKWNSLFLRRYTCCGGYMPCSGRCGESKCPELLICTQVRDLYELAPNVSDIFVIICTLVDLANSAHFLTASLSLSLVLLFLLFRFSFALEIQLHQHASCCKMSSTYRPPSVITALLYSLSLMLNVLVLN